MNIKNFLIFTFIRLIQRFLCKKNRSSSHFLIVSTTALGDTLWATPGIRELKINHPKSSLFVLTSITGSQVLQNNPYIDRIFVLKKPLLFSAWSIFWQLKKLSFKNIYILHTSQRIILPLCSLLSSEKISGNADMHKGLDSLLTHKIPRYHEHEILRRFRILSIDFRNNKQMELFINPEDRLFAKQYLNLLPKTLYIGIHLGAKDRFKQWPIESFAKLITLLHNTFSCSILIPCGPFDKELATQLQSLVPFQITCLPPLTIHQLGAVIECLDLFITNDTGPMHIAFSQNTPTIALFGPTDHTLCGPLDVSNAYILQTGLTCKPCIKKRCQNPICLKAISPEEILSITKKLLTPSLI